MPRLIPMQLQPILVLYLSQDKLTSSGSTRLYAMLEEIFELQPDRVSRNHLTVETHFAQRSRLAPLQAPHYEDRRSTN